MLSFLPAKILLIINLGLICLNTILIAVPIILLGLIRMLLPFNAIRRAIEALNLMLYDVWVGFNSLIMRLTCRIDWQISSNVKTRISGSCLIISNHLSWTDIVILCHVYRGLIPVPKFFLKHSLIYIPLVGQACWALGMPFLRRYSRRELLKNPQLRQRDIDSTKRACQLLIKNPSALVDFAEGTRYTKEKAAAVKSPYQYLMPPKAASLAIALGQMQGHLDCMLNTTLNYPYNKQRPFMDLLEGRMRCVQADLELIEIKPEMVGDYLNDKPFKHRFTMYVRDLWHKKDLKLAQMQRRNGSAALSTTLKSEDNQ